MTGQGDVPVLGPEFNLVVASCDAVREMRGSAGLDAHGVEFRDLFSQRQQAGHGAKRPPLVVEVQASDDDRIPRSASALHTSGRPSSKNWASSTPTTATEGPALTCCSKAWLLATTVEGMALRSWLTTPCPRTACRWRA